MQLNLETNLLKAAKNPATSKSLSKSLRSLRGKAFQLQAKLVKPGNQIALKTARTFCRQGFKPGNQCGKKPDRWNAFKTTRTLRDKDLNLTDKAVKKGGKTAGFLFSLGIRGSLYL